MLRYLICFWISCIPVTAACQDYIITTTGDTIFGEIKFQKPTGIAILPLRGKKLFVVRDQVLDIVDRGYLAPLRRYGKVKIKPLNKGEKKVSAPFYSAHAQTIRYVRTQHAINEFESQAIVDEYPVANIRSMTWIDNPVPAGALVGLGAGVIVGVFAAKNTQPGLYGDPEAATIFGSVLTGILVGALIDTSIRNRVRLRLNGNLDTWANDRWQLPQNPLTVKN